MHPDHDPRPQKCATEECQNVTALHLCDDCTEEQLGDYERHLERQFYRD